MYCIYMHYLFYISYDTFCTYTNNMNYDRSVKNLELQITCGKTKGRILPKVLMHWAISFALPCESAGFPTGLPGKRRPCSRPARGARPVGDPGLSPLCFSFLLTQILFHGGCLWPLFLMNIRPNRNFLFCHNATKFSNK